jgi:hypothetical protein
LKWPATHLLSWRRLCREPPKGWSLRGTITCVLITIGHGRVLKVFWGTVVPGAESWPTGETSTRLDPDGCLVRRYKATTTETTENTGASETARGKWDAMQHTSAKKMQKVCKEGILPLDRSLLMGAPSLDQDICCFLQNRLLTTSFTVDSTNPVAIGSPLRYLSP